MRLDRSSLPFLAFAAYAALSLLMVNDPARPLLPPPLSGKIQLSELAFPAAVGVWAWAGLPGLARVARAAAVPAAVWVGAVVVTAAASPWPGPAWREAAAFAYLGVVLVWGTAVLADAGRLRWFQRWWLALVAAVVVVGLAGWLVAVLAGQDNYLVEWRRGMPLFGDRVRVRSTLVPTSRLLATLLIVALPAVFVLRRHGTSGERRLGRWLLPLLALCAVLTYARQILEFVGLLGALAWLGTRRRRPAAAALALVYVAGFVAIELVSAWEVTDAELTWAADRSRNVTDLTYYATMPDVGVQTATLRVEYVHKNRFVFKRISWNAFLERPLVGWGPDTWSLLRARGQAAGWVPAHYRWDSAHSEPFNVAAEMGLVGLAAFAAFWALCLGRMWRAPGSGFAGALARAHALGGAAVLLTSVNVDLMRFRFLWIALAVGLAAAVAAREEVGT